MASPLRRFYKIIPGRPPNILGEGKEGKVTEVTLKSPYLKKRLAAQKDHSTRILGLDPGFVRAQVIYSKKVWRDFKNAKLPVTEFYTPILRKKSRHYLTILMENIEAKYGKLIPINNADGEPVFLSHLSIFRDQALIKELAREKFE